MKISPGLLLTLLLAAAAALLLAGSWYCYTSSFDTATVGLMSLNIAKGRDFPLFYYGQPYFGALEAYVAALYIRLFGFSEFVVSLSPISFTLLWSVFSYLLFARLRGARAGLVAALSVTFSGYYIFWYSIATYGGYPAIFTIGTASLWLGVLIFQDDPRGKRLLLCCCGLGILAALGVWVHALTFPYLAVTAMVLLLHLCRQRFRGDLLAALIISLLLGMLGFLPFYLETGSFFGGVSEPVQLSWQQATAGLKTLFTVNIHELVVWNFLPSLDSRIIDCLVGYGSYLLLGGALLLALINLCSNGKAEKRSRFYYLVPISFCLLFLALYVQHHMASLKAPRYAIGIWTMLLCLLWVPAVAEGRDGRLRRLPGWLLFGAWLVVQIGGTVFFIAGSSAGAVKERQAVEAVVQAAARRNLTSVVTYGDRLFGYKAPKFTMFAENEIIFAHADLERYAGNAQYTELDERRGYLATAQSKTSLEETLQELGIGFKVVQVGKYFLFSDLEQPPRLAMQAIDYTAAGFADSEPSAAQVALLQDGNQETGVAFSGESGFSLTLDVGSVRNLCGVWLFSRHNPFAFSWQSPSRVDIATSADGVDFNPVFAGSAQGGNGFYAGDSFFIGGPAGKLEASFTPVQARYLRLRFHQEPAAPLAEMLVFASDGSRRGSSLAELEALKPLLQLENVRFVYADRWASAQLRRLFAGSDREDIAAARHSTRFAARPLRQFVSPEKGNAVLCENPVAEVCARLLNDAFGEKAVARPFQGEHYTLFSLAQTSPERLWRRRSALLWNGQLPLWTDDPSLLAPWFNALGLPVWRPDFTPTTGFYHDGWTNGEGIFRKLHYQVRHQRESRLVIFTNGWRPVPEGGDVGLQVVVNDEVRLLFEKREGKEYIFHLPESLDQLESITVHSSTFAPPAGDSRHLGIDIRRIELR